MEHIQNTSDAQPSSVLTAALTPSAPDALRFTPIDLAHRSDGWTQDRQRAFIEALADCGVVRDAAAQVGMTEQSAHRLRRRPDAQSFNYAWDAAIRLGTERLRSIAVQRAVEGTVRRRFYQGEVIAEERVFDNRLLIYLLGRLPNSEQSRHVSDRIENWHDYMEAIEDGLVKALPKPNQSSRSPVWRDESGPWLTNFPPPCDFQGEEWGSFGEDDYCRTLDASERQSVEAWEARVGEEGHRRRDRYFRRLGEVSPESSPPLA